MAVMTRIITAVDFIDMVRYNCNIKRGRQMLESVEVCDFGVNMMSKKSCTMKTIEFVKNHLDWILAALVIGFVWLSGLSSLVEQMWLSGGLSFSISTGDIVRLAVGFVGIMACCLGARKLQKVIRKVGGGKC